MRHDPYGERSWHERDRDMAYEMQMREWQLRKEHEMRMHAMAQQQMNSMANCLGQAAMSPYQNQAQGASNEPVPAPEKPKEKKPNLLLLLTEE